MTTSTFEPPTYLVGIDGSDQSRDALIWATQLAERTGGTVDAVVAWRFPAAASLPIIGSPVPPVDVFEEAARHRMSATIEAAGVSPAAEFVVGGLPGQVLIDLSAKYDLVIVGRTGRGRIGRMLVGSTARHIARHAECPVAIVDGPDLFDRITVAVDGSENAVGGLRWAAAMSADFDVTLVYSHDERILEDLPLDSGLRSDLDLLANAVVERSLADAEVDAGSVTIEVRSGDPRTTIVDAVNGDLLVLGGCGQGRIAGLIGSLAGYAVDHTAGPVVVWRAPS